MSFTDIEFVYFLPAFFVAWWLARRHYHARVLVMLAGSLAFYSINNFWMLPIIVLYCLLDWAIGLWLVRTANPGRVLAFGVGVNLLVLCYWKYTPLVVETALELLGRPAALSGFTVAGGWVFPSG